MDLSKLKIDVYEFLGLIVPGLLMFAELGVSIVGWSVLAADVTGLSGTALTLVVIVSFAAGHVMQELSDFTLKLLRGSRFFKASRDEFWTSKEADAVKSRILREARVQLDSADSAFEYCLAKVQATFSKRDVFLATSDLSRALCLLFLTGLIPLCRTIYVFNPAYSHKHTLFAGFAIMLGILALMSWRRMVRFREFTEAPVFRSCLAIPDGIVQISVPRQHLQLLSATT